MERAGFDQWDLERVEAEAVEVGWTAPEVEQLIADKPPRCGPGWLRQRFRDPATLDQVRSTIDGEQRYEAEAVEYQAAVKAWRSEIRQHLKLHVDRELAALADDQLAELEEHVRRRVSFHDPSTGQVYVPEAGSWPCRAGMLMALATSGGREFSTFNAERRDIWYARWERIKAVLDAMPEAPKRPTYRVAEPEIPASVRRGREIAAQRQEAVA